MNLKALWHKWSREAGRRKDPVSVVLLQRSPRFVTKDLLEQAATRAWNRSFESEGEGSRHFVVQELPTETSKRYPKSDHLATLLKVGPWLLNLIHVPQPYASSMNSEALASFLPQQAQRDAWLAHSAWLAIDCHNKDKEDELKYCIMANLAAELLDENISGIYFPAMQSMAPHDDELYTSLKSIAKSREVTID